MKKKSRRSCSTGEKVEDNKIEEKINKPDKRSSLTISKVTEDDISNINLNVDNVDKSLLLSEIFKAKNELLASKDTIIHGLNEKVILLNEKINFLNEKITSLCVNRQPESIFTKNEEKQSFSECLKRDDRIQVVASTVPNGIQQKLTLPILKNVLIIKPKKVQENKTTKKELADFINPSKLKVNILKTVDSKEGAVKIHCEKKEDVLKIQAEVEKKFKSKYEINVEQKLPRVKIVGIDGYISDEDLKKNLKTNEFLENAQINVIVIKKKK